MVELESIIQETVTKILKDYCAKEVVDQAEQGIFPDKLWEELVELGITKIAVPEENGGTGFSYKDAFNILKIAGEYAAPIPLAETIIGNWALYKVGLPVTDEISTVAFEDNVTVTKENEQFVVNGEVKRVPFARYARNLVLVTKNNVLLVDIDNVKLSENTNLAGEPRDTLTLDEITISNEKVAEITVDDYEWLKAAIMLSKTALMAGALEKISNITIQYVNEREQFGRPIGKFQAVKQQLAVMASHIASANIAADNAIDSFEHGRNNMDNVMAKIRVGDAATIVAPITHQVHAAIGFTYEHQLHHSTRRLWSWREEAGSEHFWAAQVGGELIDSNEPLWDILTK